MTGGPHDLEPLPPLYSRWLSQALGGLPERETKATCDRCIMCDPGVAMLPGVHQFDPDVKCCSYVPTLVNFLVGAIIADPSTSPVGRASVSERIGRLSGVTPLGLAAPPIFDHTYDQLRGEVFGRAPDLRCPHFLEEGGRCGIWQHRNATCSTYFCRHVRGRWGRRSWADIELVLRAVERDLSFWCCQRLGLGSDQLRDLLAYRTRPAIELMRLELRGGWGPVYGRLWGDWVGREEAFFRRCAELTRQLEWSDVATIVGAETLTKVTVAAASLGEVGAGPPTVVVRPNPLRLINDGTRLILIGELPNEPVEVDAAAVSTLEATTRCGTEALSRALGPSLVQRLLDVGILAPAPPPG